MKVVFHPKVQFDILKDMEYYDAVAAPELAGDFFRELIRFVETTAERPDSYAVREGDIRRVNLRRFPYHSCFVS